MDAGWEAPREDTESPSPLPSGDNPAKPGKLDGTRRPHLFHRETDMAEKLTKQEAVRRALNHLGPEAKPTQIQGWIKDQFNIEMGRDHISTSKGDILRKAGK